MSCKTCHSANQRVFRTEIAIHTETPTQLDRPHVFLFPKLLICGDCGFAEFTIEKSKLSPSLFDDCETESVHSATMAA